jgi:hypothetical protein
MPARIVPITSGIACSSAVSMNVQASRGWINGRLAGWGRAGDDPVRAHPRLKFPVLCGTDDHR